MDKENVTDSLKQEGSEASPAPQPAVAPDIADETAPTAPEAAASPQAQPMSARKVFKSFLLSVLLGIFLGILAYFPVNNYLVSHPQVAQRLGLEVTSAQTATPEAAYLHNLFETVQILHKYSFKETKNIQYLNGAIKGLNYVLRLQYRDKHPDKYPKDEQDKSAAQKEGGQEQTAEEAAPNNAADLKHDQDAEEKDGQKAHTEQLSEEEIIAAIDKKIQSLEVGPDCLQLEELSPDLSDSEMVSEFSARYLKALLQADSPKEEEELAYSALNGATIPTNDPFTVALLPDSYKALQQSLGDETYGGVGIYLEGDRKNNNQLTVLEPIEGSPAYKAGLQPGDCIMSVDGKPTKSMETDVASAAIRGPKGSQVVLVIKRKDKPEFSVTMTREDIHIDSTKISMLNDHIGYLRLRFFGGETGLEFSKALESLEKQGAQALILDLRNNGGGYVVAALDVMSHFLPEGATVTAVVHPRLGRSENYNIEKSTDKGLPVVVLANRFSASASEIVAGAFKDYKRGVLVGENTFGKGSVQTLQPYDDGGAIKFTCAHYLTPAGLDIHMKGLAPDVEVEDTPSNKDSDPDNPQMKAALKEAERLYQDKLAGRQ